MTARQQRRREEHKARKEAYKAQKQAEREAAPVPAQSPVPELPTASPTRAEINRANAQHSTGPKTEAGRATSSQNAIRQGLASKTFVVLEWENYDDFLDLLTNLRAEHQPAAQTEALLVEKMAEHFWLSQRALRLQDMCLRMDIPLCDQPKELALYIRYGTTHDRAFHKCLSDLLKLRAEQRKVESGFVSQKQKQAAEIRRQELHEAKLRALNAKSKTQKIGEETEPAPSNTTIAEQTTNFSVRMPRSGEVHVPFTALKHLEPKFTTQAA